LCWLFFICRDSDIFLVYGKEFKKRNRNEKKRTAEGQKVHRNRDRFIGTGSKTTKQNLNVRSHK